MQMNYLFAVLLSLFFYQPMLPSGKSLGLILAIGIPTGFLYVAGFYFLAYNIRQNGAILSSSISKMGILFSIALSYLLFREKLSLFQISGLTLGILSMLLYFEYFNRVKENNDLILKPNRFLLFLLLLSQGLAEITNKLFSFYGNLMYKPLFLFIVFFVAFCFCSFLLIQQKGHTTNLKKEIGFGFLLGIPNYFSSYFFIDAFKTLPSPIVFSLFSMGTILLVAFVSSIFFKEKIDLNKFVFLFFILISIWLLNL